MKKSLARRIAQPAATAMVSAMAVAGIVGVAAPAAAAECGLSDGCTESHTVSVAQEDFPAISQLAVPQFDDEGGARILDAIQLDVSVTGAVVGIGGNPNATLENLSEPGPAKTWTVSLDASLSVTGRLLQADGTTATVYTAEAHADEVYTLESGEIVQIESLTAADSTSSGVVPIAGHEYLLDDYVGTGELVYMVSSMLTSDVAGATSSFDFAGDASGSATITVVYTWHDAPDETAPGPENTPPSVASVADPDGPQVGTGGTAVDGPSPSLAVVGTAAALALIGAVAVWLSRRRTIRRRGA